MIKVEPVCKHRGKMIYDWVIILTDDDTDEAREYTSKHYPLLSELHCLRQIKNWLNNSEALQQAWERAVIVQKASPL